jgi:hypothetical protein
MRIMSLDAIVDKWNSRASVASADYESGLKNPRVPWQSATLAAADNYKSGVTAAIANNLFAKGVRKTSDADWLAAAISKGVPRWTDGISKSLDAYRAGYEPFYNALSAATLPPRMPRGHEQNYVRSRNVGNLLHALRIKRMSS